MRKTATQFLNGEQEAIQFTSVRYSSTENQKSSSRSSSIGTSEGTGMQKP